MKEQIQKLIEDSNPKHVSRFIKKNTEMWDWVMKRSIHLSDEVSDSERIYAAISGKINYCNLSKKYRKFKDINYGYNFCGKTGKCECARKQVSESVSKSHNLRTEKQIEESSAKRVATSLERHGVTNNGQTEHALEQHKAFYDNEDKVRELVDYLESYFMKNYGVKNAAQIPGVREKAAQTYFEKTGYDNPGKNPLVKLLKIEISRRNWGTDYPHQNPIVAQKLSDALRRIEDQDSFTIYTDLVNRHTRPFRKQKQKEGYVFGSGNGDWQIDHIISKAQGFLEGIPAEIIGSEFNLQIIKGLDNKKKSDSPQSDVVVNMIIEKYNQRK